MADRTREPLERSVELAAEGTVCEILVRYNRHVESFDEKNGQATRHVAIIGYRGTDRYVPALAQDHFGPASSPPLA